MRAGAIMATVIAYRAALCNKGAMDPLPPDLASFVRDQLGGESDASPGTFQTEGPIWIWTGSGKTGEPAKGRWYFLGITGECAVQIRAASSGRAGGWGSVKVSATIGSSTWTTSLFPSQSAGGYILPLKAAIRKKEGLAEGNTVAVSLVLA